MLSKFSLEHVAKRLPHTHGKNKVDMYFFGWKKCGHRFNSTNAAGSFCHSFALVDISKNIQLAGDMRFWPFRSTGERGLKRPHTSHPGTFRIHLQSTTTRCVFQKQRGGRFFITGVAG